MPEMTSEAKPVFWLVEEMDLKVGCGHLKEGRRWKIMGEKNNGTDEARRDFLKKSVYVAYATPVIMSMLVNKANAAKSWNSGKGEITGPATPKPPDGGTVGPDPGRGRDDRPTP
jgi:hypothetical protein